MSVKKPFLRIVYELLATSGIELCRSWGISVRGRKPLTDWSVLPNACGENYWNSRLRHSARPNADCTRFGTVYTKWPFNPFPIALSNQFCNLVSLDTKFISIQYSANESLLNHTNSPQISVEFNLHKLNNIHPPDATGGQFQALNYYVS